MKPNGMSLEFGRKLHAEQRLDLAECGVSVICIFWFLLGASAPLLPAVLNQPIIGDGPGQLGSLYTEHFTENKRLLLSPHRGGVR